MPREHERGATSPSTARAQLCSDCDTEYANPRRIHCKKCWTYREANGHRDPRIAGRRALVDDDVEADTFGQPDPPTFAHIASEAMRIAAAVVHPDPDWRQRERIVADAYRLARDAAALLR